MMATRTNRCPELFEGSSFGFGCLASMANLLVYGRIRAKNAHPFTLWLAAQRSSQMLARSEAASCLG